MIEGTRIEGTAIENTMSKSALAFNADHPSSQE